MEKHLKRYYGFNAFKTGQKEVIKNILNGESAAAIFPTGAGKSLCYQLPALLLPHLTLVVSPLLSLMKDQLDFLLSKNIPAARLDSTLNKFEYNRILTDAKKGDLKILMISVERFKNERFRYHLQQMKISLLVIDEAHCISEWGHNFRPEYLKIPYYKSDFNIPQVLLLTATATAQVINDMCQKLHVPESNVTLTGFYRDNLFLQITPVNELEKKSHLIDSINKNINESTIIYVTLQKTAENIAELLIQKGINAHFYHAGLKSDERENIQNKFMNGELNCIVATIAFGMGIDKKDIRKIIHYDLPKSIENYSQEIGRSGRDGEKSFCETFANLDNVNILENFIYGDTPEKQSISQLITLIKENRGFIWEIKPQSLANDLNIRILPLKTLLVYLDMEGIISPKYSYFENYSFKYNTEPENIIGSFSAERKKFTTLLLKNCHSKKTWTYVDIDGVLEQYKTDRKRIISALEYFDEKGFIELSAKQTIDVYDIKRQDFNTDQLTDKMFNLFKNKEKVEIKRINNMIDFFESDSCLSKNLAHYFGENINKNICGHCSFCTSGKIEVSNSAGLQSISSYNFDELSSEFIEIIGNKFSILNLTKFLCGIYTPAFARLKIKQLNSFGVLEKYRFADIKNWIKSNC
ncbi:MAG: RecQ family ATP-dependent DNA helicase [bacterium]|nr:RecQ family ATP-dependent DNA helicase [bacterium]